MFVLDTLKNLDFQIATLRSHWGAKWSILFLLMPLLCFGGYHFGVWALWVVLVSVGSCMMFGIISQILNNESFRWIHPGSIITGLLLGLTLRAETPGYMILIGALVAEYLGKHLTDAQQRPLLNPAILGRTAVGLLETFHPPQAAIDSLSSASVLSKGAGGNDYPGFAEVFLGFRSGAIGETHTLLLLLIAFLLLRYVILKWETVVAMLLTVFLMIWILPPTAEIVGHAPWFSNPVIYLFGGSTLFCALFFASDPATTPTTRWGCILFGIGAGMIGVLGKVYTSIQGIEMYGILLMNLTVPFLNHWLKPPDLKVPQETGSPLKVIVPPEKLKISTPVHFSASEGVRSFYASDGKSMATEMKSRKPKHPQGVHVPHFKAYAEKEHFTVFKHILTQEIDCEVLLETIKQVGLRGCGGAYFPTHSKWLSVSAQPSPHILVVNGLEGEPQSFKDLYLMQHHAMTLVEGAAIAAYTVGAEYLYFVINSGYREAFSQVSHAVQQFQQHFGHKISFSMEVVKGPDPELYVCGEETALIQYLQSQRAEPQLRPPFPTERGLWGRPTLVNNVETLSWLPILLDPDSPWSKNPQTPLLKLISLSGAILQKGVYEISLGETLGEILQKGGGMKPNETLLAFAVGGISGGFLPPHCTTLRYESESLLKAGAMLGSGAIEVFSHSADLWKEAMQVAQFFMEESCGRCTPCRVGTQQLVHLWENSNRSTSDLNLFLEVSEAMRLSSSCSLGVTASRPLLSILRYWGTTSTDTYPHCH